MLALITVNRFYTIYKGAKMDQEHRHILVLCGYFQGWLLPQPKYCAAQFWQNFCEISSGIMSYIFLTGTVKLPSLFSFEFIQATKYM